MIIGILDYGMGNIGSIRNMLKRVTKCSVKNIRNVMELDEADKIIIPGVGAYDAGMELLEKNNLADAVRKFAFEDKKPVLGICLGMQLLGNKSEEGKKRGLGLIDFDVVKFCADEKKVPHMGWNYVQIRKIMPLTEGVAGDDNRYYFVHSYHAVCKNECDILMACRYGDEFPAAVGRRNIYGVQFHPEKSHFYGMKILKNFAEVC